MEDDTTGAELDPVRTSRGAEEIAGTDSAGEWPEAISDLTMFLTRDPSSETTAGDRVVEVGVEPEPDDIMHVGS